MEDVCRIKLMPRAVATYNELKCNASKLPIDPYSPTYYQLRPYARMLGRVNSIPCSLMDPGNLYMDQPLLESLSWIHTRSLDSTLVYFIRVNDGRLLNILHITEYDSTHTYARFCAFMDSGGWTILADLGVEVPSENIGSSGTIQ